MRTDGRTDRHDEAKSRHSQFYERAWKRLSYAHNIDIEHTHILCDVNFCSIYILWSNIREHYGLNFSCNFNCTLLSTKFRLDLFMLSDLKHVSRQRDTSFTSLPSCKDRMKKLKLKFRPVFQKAEHYTWQMDNTMSCPYIGGFAQ